MTEFRHSSRRGIGAYAHALAPARVKATVCASVLARLPVGMGAVALVLYVHRVTGSFAAAGIVAGAFTIGLGITGPVLGRLIDRRGSRPVLLPAAAVAAGSLAAVVLLGDSGAGTGPTALAAGLAGAATPPISGVMRQRWPHLVPARDLPTTFAIDSLMVEAIFISGPLLAGVFAATLGPAAGLLAASGSGLLGTLWFASLAELPPAGEAGARRGWAGAAASRGIRLLILTGIPMGGTFGALDVALPAFGSLHGNSALGGPFAAALSFGSALGGLLYGAWPHRLGHPRRAFLLLAALQSATCLPLLLAPDVPEMFVAAALAGTCVAPLVNVRNQLAHETMPPGTGTEGFTWLSLSITLGAGLGSALAGPLVEAGGWRAGAIVACALPAAAALLGLAGRGALLPEAAEKPAPLLAAAGEE